jgi:hypothetical protein
MQNQKTNISRASEINLTPHNVDGCSASSVPVLTSQLIAYDQRNGFTRLWLAGGKVLDVKEGTDRIDSLIRGASSN